IDSAERPPPHPAIATFPSMGRLTSFQNSSSLSTLHSAAKPLGAACGEYQHYSLLFILFSLFFTAA
ncbi:MAG: hypothetical protein ACI4RP_04955, partial [Acutalibacteraceae bacterium]